MLLLPALSSIPVLTPKERVWKLFLCRNKYLGEGKRVHMLIFEGPQQNSSSAKTGHPPTGMPHHAHRACNKSFSLTHSLWKTARDHSTFEGSLHQERQGSAEVSTFSRVVLWREMQIHWSVAGRGCGGHRGLIFLRWEILEYIYMPVISL